MFKIGYGMDWFSLGGVRCRASCGANQTCAFWKNQCKDQLTGILSVPSSKPNIDSLGNDRMLNVGFLDLKKPINMCVCVECGANSLNNLQLF